VPEQGIADPGRPLYRDGSEAPPSWVGKVRSWCLVQQPVPVVQLAGFDLVVVREPLQALTSWLTPELVHELRVGGIRLAAHIPLVRPMAGVPTLEPGDAASLLYEPWFATALARVRAVALGPWDGCYLDELATVLGYPGGTAAVTDLIALARRAGRGGIVIVQSVEDEAVVAAADLVGVPAELP
jgi:hypothetical protein